MTSLPLWKIPFVARRVIFCQMNPKDVFNLSMTSMKSKLIIMTFHKLPPARLDWDIGLYQGNHWNGTCAVRRVEDQMQLTISFMDPNLAGIRVFVEDLRAGESLKNPSLRNVNRTPILMSEGWLDSFLVCKKGKRRTFKQKLEVMEMISRHLLDIVDVKSYDLSYNYHADLPMTKFIKCFVFDVTRKFKEVRIFDHKQHLEAHEFNFLMNEIQVDKMELNTLGRVKGVFTHPKIEFGRYSAVSFDNILNLQCEIFESRMDRLLRPTEFVKLLLAWVNGEKLQNLKKLIIHHDYELNNKNLIKQVRKRVQKMEGEVPFEIVKREPGNAIQDIRDVEEVSDQEDVDDEEEENDDEEEDDSEENEQDDVEMADKIVRDEEDEVQYADKEDDSEESADEQDSYDMKFENNETKEEQDEEISDGLESDEDGEETDADSDSEEDSEEDIDAESDSEDEEEVISDDDESDTDEMEDSDQDDVDEEDDDELLIKRKSDGKVMSLQTFYGSFEIKDMTKYAHFFKN